MCGDGARMCKDEEASVAGRRGPAASRGEIRERLASAAKELFTEQDFPSVTIRAIADRAECDPGLVSYYFGSKAGIFREAMSLPADPVQLISDAFGDGGRGTGERVLLAIMELWEESEAGANFRVMVTSVLSSDLSLQVFRAWMNEQMLTPLVERLGVPDARLRIEMAFSQALGLFATRYVYEMEGLAAMPRQQLARIYGAYLDLTLGSFRK